MFGLSHLFNRLDKFFSRIMGWSEYRTPPTITLIDPTVINPTTVTAKITISCYCNSSVADTEYEVDIHSSSPHLYIYCKHCGFTGWEDNQFSKSFFEPRKPFPHNVEGPSLITQFPHGHSMEYKRKLIYNHPAIKK